MHLDPQHDSPGSTSPQAAKRRYAQRIAGGGIFIPWWTTVIVTAGSARQAARYEEEIARRGEQGKIPAGVRYLAVSDIDDERIGSGGATLNALRTLVEDDLGNHPTGSLEAWWADRRVLIIHSGGDSRRLPQYSLSGKLFSALPVKTPWGEVSTVFDEMLALSTAWVERLDSGLVVASGDVILTFDAAQLRWDRPGVSGVAMRESLDVGCRHGVYVADESGRVYSFLQKPTVAELHAAGGVLPDDRVALDTGLLRFDARVAARLTRLTGIADGVPWQVGDGILARGENGLPVIDLYEHITLALTGEWVPQPERDAAGSLLLAEALRGIPFRCDLVDGDFTHIGTTTLFRQLMTEETNFTRLYEAQQRLGTTELPGLRSAGVVIDSVLAGGGEIGLGALAIECELHVPVHAARGAILHGLSALSTMVDVPEDTVVHQVPILLPDGRNGVVIRAYGVSDDPKHSAASGAAGWFGRPMPDVLASLGIDPALVWPDCAADARTLWNARLFPLTTPEEAWECASWLMGMRDSYSAGRWARHERLSLADSARWADIQALASTRNLRLQANWLHSALALAKSGSDIRPLLAHSPGITALATTGRSLCKDAGAREASHPTDAASHYYQAGLFLGHAGLTEEAEQAHDDAFRCIRQAVDAGIAAEPMAEKLSEKDVARDGTEIFVPGKAECLGVYEEDIHERHSNADRSGKIKSDRAQAFPAISKFGPWSQDTVTASAPARIDLGGGWSDTPPFCLDWGGTVLNIAVLMNRTYPIHTTVRRLDEPILRCISGEHGEVVEYRTVEDMLAPPSPGCPFSITRMALQMAGLVPAEGSLEQFLSSRGGGLEILTAVDLPMGSGLGTSSILAATMLRALAAMQGVHPSDARLSDAVMRLEQTMTTGGGWQDQVGGIFPGAKLITTGPGLRQRVRVQPVNWSAERQVEFTDRFLIYFTGIRRIARNLLAQVVGSYLAREATTLQVLHSIKTLAVEMSYALQEGEWDYLGQLLDRHWALNQQLDPHTTNAPINALLQDMRPYLAGAKLAGAGGGGFLLLLARDPDAARALRAHLSNPTLPGQLYDYAIAPTGLHVKNGD